MLKNLLGSFLFLFLSFSGFSQTTYNGNTRSGFGGAVGTGSLTLTPSGNNITFNLTRGSGTLNDIVVIYIDSKSGGFSSTSSFTDAADDHRRAISGYNGGDRSTLNFPAGFTPDYAIAFNGSFAGLWELTTGSHNFVTSLYPGAAPGNTAANYSFTLDKNNIGISGDIIFNLLVAYISGSAWRSNEFIGDPGPASNPEHGSYTATTYIAYNAVLPVKIKNFNVQKGEANNILSWDVEEEIGVKGYHVERYLDGMRFTSIGFLKSSKKSNYQFTDHSVQGQSQYYRLTIEDEDGSKKHSNIVSVKNDRINNLSIKKIYPNPINDGVNILLQSPKEDIIQIQIYDISGKMIKSESRKLDLGINNIKVNTSTIASGVYKMKLMCNDKLLSVISLLK